MRDDLLGDRPENELGDPVEPGAADDNKCGVLSGVKQCCGGGAGVERPVDGHVGSRCLESSDGVVENSLRGVADAVVGETDGGRSEANGWQRDRPTVYDVERQVATGCYIQGPSGSGEGLF
jgi:hypothetical protein